MIMEMEMEQTLWMRKKIMYMYYLVIMGNGHVLDTLDASENDVHASFSENIFINYYYYY